MKKARLAVLKIVSKTLTVSQAANEYGYSRRHLHRLLTRYREGGIDAVDPKSRRPHSNARATPDPVKKRILELRNQLTADGFDAGPVTIAWHLDQKGLLVPATSTIRRILTKAGLVTPEPKKRPKSSYIRFEADRPNETWQSDFTYWRLSGGEHIHILNWLDDHSRMLLSMTAHHSVDGPAVVDTFRETIEIYGPPQSTLTDNGVVYTTRYAGRGGGRNEFEHLLRLLGIKQKNGSPGHP